MPHYTLWPTPTVVTKKKTRRPLDDDSDSDSGIDEEFMNAGLKKKSNVSSPKKAKTVSSHDETAYSLSKPKKPYSSTDSVATSPDSTCGRKKTSPQSQK